MRLLLACLLLCFVQNVCAQQTPKNKKKKTDTEELSLENDTLPNMEYRLISDSVRKAEFLEQRKRRSSRKKKKEKKIYYGIKTKVLSVRKDDGTPTIDIAQYIPATYLLNDNYQQAIYYYDTKARKIKNDNYQNLTAKIKKGLQVYLLHGKFERIKNGNTHTLGYYYKGLTHDTWKVYGKDATSENSLSEKLTYHMGHSQESRITYYDGEQTKFKEIIPVEHKILHGKYYRFHENGVLAEVGEYENGVKVDIWTEYYDSRQRKRQVQYTPSYSWHDPAQPYLYMEWERAGKVVYEYKNGKEKKIVNE